MKSTPAKIPRPSRKGKRVVAIDTETELITEETLTPDLVCVTYAYVHKGEIVSGIFHHTDPKLKPWLLNLFNDPDTIIVGANNVYDDVGVLCTWDPDLIEPIFCAYDEDRVEDVQTRQKLIDIACGRLGGEHIRGVWVEYLYNLAALELRLLGYDRSASKGPDAWRLRYGELKNVPLKDWPAEAVQYPIDDAEGALGVYYEQVPHEHLLEDAFRQQRAHAALHLMSCVGLNTEAEAVDAYEVYTRHKMQRTRDILLKAGLIEQTKKPSKAQKEKGVPPPWFKRNMKLAQERMLKVHPDGPKNDPSTKFPEGSPKLDKDACDEAGDELLSQYQEFGSTSLILGNIEDLRKGIKNPIRSRFEILKETGRTGSSKPNVQNRRKEFGDRECFVPPPGYVFMQADFEGLELRTFAQICLWFLGYSRMAEVINSGKDPHLVMAANLLRIPYDEAVKRHKAKDKIVKRARDLAKIANFGFIGGLGAEALVMQARVKYSMIICDGTQHAPYGVCQHCVSDARVLRRVFKSTWDEATEYLDRFIPDLCRGGVATITHPYSERRRGGVSYTDGANGFFQGLGADAAKQALWELTVACYVDRSSILYGDRPNLFVHDEVIGLTRLGPQAHDHAMEWSRIMCVAAEKWHPDLKASAPPVLMMRWSKMAEAVYDENGRLIPWDIDVNAKFMEIISEWK